MGDDVHSSPPVDLESKTKMETVLDSGSTTVKIQNPCMQESFSRACFGSTYTKKNCFHMNALIIH